MPNWEEIDKKQTRASGGKVLTRLFSKMLSELSSPNETLAPSNFSRLIRNGMKELNSAWKLSTDEISPLAVQFDSFMNGLVESEGPSDIKIISSENTIFPNLEVHLFSPGTRFDYNPGIFPEEGLSGVPMAYTVHMHTRKVLEASKANAILVGPTYNTREKQYSRPLPGQSFVHTGNYLDNGYRHGNEVMSQFPQQLTGVLVMQDSTDSFILAKDYKQLLELRYGLDPSVKVLGLNWVFNSQSWDTPTVFAQRECSNPNTFNGLGFFYRGEESIPFSLNSVRNNLGAQDPNLASVGVFIDAIATKYGFERYAVGGLEYLSGGSVLPQPEDLNKGYLIRGPLLMKRNDALVAYKD